MDFNLRSLLLILNSFVFEAQLKGYCHYQVAGSVHKSIAKTNWNYLLSYMNRMQRHLIEDDKPYRDCMALFELEWLSSFTNFFRIPSLFPPSLWARVLGILLQKPSLPNDQPSTSMQYFIFCLLNRLNTIFQYKHSCCCPKDGRLPVAKD